MDGKTREQAVFALEDDNEIMAAALDRDSGLDEQNRRMNRDLIKKHEKILAKIEKGDPLTQMDLILIRDANLMDYHDTADIREHHKQAVELNDWLDKMIELTKAQAMKILDEHLDKDAQTPARVYRALHTLWEESTPDGVTAEPAFSGEGMCLKCGSKVSFADATDTIVFAGDEIVKKYTGDITNRNCVRCNYPHQYEDYKEYDSG